MIQLNETQIKYVKDNFNVDTNEYECIEFLDNEDFIDFIIGNGSREKNYEGEAMTIEECIFQSILIRCNLYAFRNVLEYLDYFTNACIDNEYYEIAENVKELKTTIHQKMNDFQHYLLNS